MAAPWGCGGSAGNAPESAEPSARVDVEGEDPGGVEPGQAAAADPVTSEEWLGDHVRWIASLISQGPSMPGADELAARFAPGFLEAVPPQSLRAGLLTLGARGDVAFVEWLQPPAEHRAEALLGGEGGYLRVLLVVDPAAPSQMTGLRMLDAPELDPTWTPAASWEALDAELAAMAERVGFLAAEVDEGGTCRVVHGLDADAPRAAGSVFKLYALAALADAVYAGEHAWDELLAVREDWKSLPTGRMHNEAAGTEFTLREFAEAMISISDNTATDHILELLGREAVEAAVVRAGHADPALLRPFLFSRDIFWLKLQATPDVRARYLEADEAGRRAILEGERAFDFATALFGAGFWTSPRALEIEWYMSSEDACRALAYIRRGAEASGDSTALEILSRNPGIELDPAAWAYVGYKGGSEPGVLAFDWLLRRADGRWFALSLSLNDDEEMLTDDLVTPLLSMRAAARLLAGEE